MAHEGVRIALFPELAVCGYTCADLLLQDTLIEGAQQALRRIAAETALLPMVVVVGAPMTIDGILQNCAVVIANGQIKGSVSKTYLPNYGEFQEKRWFTRGRDNNHLFEVDGIRFGIELCEDMWAPLPPSTRIALAGADIILNMSASDALVGKRKALIDLIKDRSFTCKAAYVYASAGYGESTTDMVFDGKAIIAEQGMLLAESPRWQRTEFFEYADIDIELIRSNRRGNTTFGECALREVQPNAFTLTNVTPKLPQMEVGNAPARKVDPMPFVPADPTLRAETADEIMHIQTLGLARRLEAAHCRSLTIGVSGGLDSTLALLVACRTFDMLSLPRTGIIAVTMPGFGTSNRTKTNANALMEALGVTAREIHIGPAVNQHFADINHNPEQRDTTYENAQARLRTLLLMDIANQSGGIVLGTGDLSELCLGWCTYNGDHMSMYGINAGVPKTAVRMCVAREAQLLPALAPMLQDIIDTPVSPELLPAAQNGEIAQITEDTVGPYELHDFFIYHILHLRRRPAKVLLFATKAFEGVYSRETIEKWLRVFIKRFFTQQFKRSCLPDGPKVGSVSISPRGDWRMPSDANADSWLSF